MIYLDRNNNFSMSIDGLHIKYTRLIDTKLLTINIECESSDEVLDKLDVLSSCNDDKFKVIYNLSKGLEDEL